MRQMICAVVAVASVTLAAGVANAQSQIEGFYVGLTGGWDFQARPAVDHSWRTNWFKHPTLHGGSEKGPKAGALVGYNWQAGPWIFGTEARLQYLWSKQSAHANIPWPFAMWGITERRNKWQGDVSFRLGREVGDCLMFSKLGIGAENKSQTKRTQSAVFSYGVDSYSRENALILVGGGVERNLFGRYFARLEGEYTAHLTRTETYFTPSVNATIGLRF